MANHRCGRYGRGDIAIAAVMLSDAIRETGERGMDWEGVADALDEFRRMSGRTMEREPRRRDAYRWMDALEATGLFELIDGTSMSPRRRIRRIQPQRSAA